MLNRRIIQTILKRKMRLGRQYSLDEIFVMIQDDQSLSENDWVPATRNGSIPIWKNLVMNVLILDGSKEFYRDENNNFSRGSSTPKEIRDLRKKSRRRSQPRKRDFVNEIKEFEESSQINPTGKKTVKSSVGNKNRAKNRLVPQLQNDEKIKFENSIQIHSQSDPLKNLADFNNDSLINWPDAELSAVVEAYMTMLQLDQKGLQYEKLRDKLNSGKLNRRTKGEIESRMRNISTVLKEDGRPWIDTYQPRDNVGEKGKHQIRVFLNRYFEKQTYTTMNIEETTAQRNGPSPREKGYTVSPTDLSNSRCVTYIVRFGNTEVFKVGWTGRDIDDRLEELNEHIPHSDKELPELPSWELIFLSEESTAQKAFQCEQEILNRVGGYRTLGERFVCSTDEVVQISQEFNMKNSIKNIERL